MGEVRVVGIRIEQPQNQPVLLLRESNGDRYLPDLDRADGGHRDRAGTAGRGARAAADA